MMLVRLSDQWMCKMVLESEMETNFAPFVPLDQVQMFEVFACFAVASQVTD